MPPDPAAARADPPRPGRAPLDVLELLRIVVRLADGHSALLEQATGFPGAQLWALHEVAAAEGLTVGELAGRLRVHQPTASNLLNRLEVQGLVRKDRSAADRRLVHLHLTAAGRRVLQRAPAATRGLLPHVLDTLTPAQLRKVHAGLALLVEAMGGFDAALAARPLPFTE